ncbi:MAG: tetratricopeptide repeat protein [Gemmatimonadaceae bacterium]|nr:tetratricopeptide repeat protein [Gemmatimonadaceae bacterium]
MSTAVRIDELRKKFEENPRRYFAPLANEYRKAGDLLQAIGLCREHLPKQPGHMSGYIVFGQALYESGELVEAQSVFEQALALDPENLIALHHLGDIAHDRGDFAAARRWYERVLDADPRNDEIAAQLANLAASRTPASVPVVPNFDTLAKAPETPAVAMEALGATIVPTPDAVLRAVDVDAWNARPASHSPIDLEAMVDGSDATIRSVNAVNESVAAPLVSSVPDESDPFGFPESTDAVDVTSPSDFLATAEHADAEADAQSAAAAMSFEEGLVAPLWPDTSDLVTRATTPRETAASVPSPRSVQSIDDAISAFGRESYDLTPVDAADAVVSEPPTLATSGDEPSFTIEPFAPVAELHAADESLIETQEFEAPVSSAPEFDAPVFAEASSIETSSIETSSFEAPSIDAMFDAPDETVFDAPEEAIFDVPAYEANYAPDEYVPEYLSGTPTDETVAEQIADIEPVADEQELLPSVELFAPADDVISPLFEEASDAATMDDTSLPWLAESATTPAASFANVTEMYDADEPIEAAEPSAPAFVTETMAELLVTQGFIQRAVEVYDELVRRRPYDSVLRDRADEVRAMLTASPEALTEKADTPVYSIGHQFEAPPIDESALPFQPTSAFHESMSDTEETTIDPWMGRAASLTPSRSFVTPSYATPAIPLIAQPFAALEQPTDDVPRTPAAFFAQTPTMTPSLTPAATPAIAPYAQPVREQEPERRLAREWFAALAARRVPRRTPAQPTQAVVASPEGLAALFGNEAATQDDIAARALADAFAPVSAEELEAGSALDFEFARQTTPSYTTAIPSGSKSMAPIPATTSPTPRAMTPAIGASAVNMAPPVTTPSSNAGFAFDKFFPDPAARRGTPMATTPVVPPPAVTDDLAQFSQWLKGLGHQ